MISDEDLPYGGGVWCPGMCLEGDRSPYWGLRVPVPQDAPSGADVGSGTGVCDASCGACGSSLCTMTHSGRFRVRRLRGSHRGNARPGAVAFALLRAASPSKSLSVRAG